jgi:hypothetical protein
MVIFGDPEFVSQWKQLLQALHESSLLPRGAMRMRAAAASSTALQSSSTALSVVTYAVAPASFILRTTSSDDAVRGEDGNVGLDGFNPLGCFEAVELGHVNVHYDHVGLQNAGSLDSFQAIRRLPDNF